MAQIFPVFKPKGISSYDVIRQLKNKFPGEKIGHGGTLDPLAEGVLVIGVGREATKKLQEVLKGTTKTYEATIELGKVSETDDGEGPITPREVRDIPSQKKVTELLTTFEGESMQQPPRYSAIKISGQPAYKRARRNETFEMPTKQITIYSLQIIEYKYPFLTVLAEVSSGTYIRSLARDLGNELKTGGYLQSLKRTAVGNFRIEDIKDIHSS